MTQQEFEASIKDDYEKYPVELRVWQAAPLISPYLASVKITNHQITELEELYDSFSVNVMRFLTWARYKRLYQYRKDKAEYIDIRTDTDHNDAGYSNIYRAINVLVPYLEDCRFFISDNYDRAWLDEYQIVNGKLFFQRNEFKDENASITAYLEKKASEGKPDKELKKLAAIELLQQVDLLRSQPTSKKGKKGKASIEDKANSCLARALKLDPEAEVSYRQFYKRRS